MRLYEKYSGEDLRIAELIQRRRYQILVHSYIYYEKNENLVSDATWSKWANELVSLQKNYPILANSAAYAEAFADFDGSTGAFLPYTLPNIVSIAEMLMASRAEKKEPEKIPHKRKGLIQIAPLHK